MKYRCSGCKTTQQVTAVQWNSIPESQETPAEYEQGMGAIGPVARDQRTASFLLSPTVGRLVQKGGSILS